MNDITLLIMAAGMGSRYGGLKQLDAVGPNGETIIDYSVYDAVEAGFSKVVFIIRREFEKEFKERISDKYAGKIQVDFAFQDLNALPDGFTSPEGREKPWGTGQAIISAVNLINEPFVVINGDDYYGRESFKVVADYYGKGADQFSMVSFRLDKTLSIFGGVTRGLCTVKEGKLDTVIETENLQKTEIGVSSDRDIELNGTEPVSMNMWEATTTICASAPIDWNRSLLKKRNHSGSGSVPGGSATVKHRSWKFCPNGLKFSKPSSGNSIKPCRTLPCIKRGRRFQNLRFV